MVYIDGIKYACERCIRGHRVTNCQHSDQPLIKINPRGRPASQCAHCREHRKTKLLHTKCQCGGKNPHTNSCPCAFVPELCTCAKKSSSRSSSTSSSSMRRTSSNPPPTSSSRVHTPGGVTTSTSSQHFGGGANATNNHHNYSSASSNAGSPVARSASTTSLVSSRKSSAVAGGPRGRSSSKPLSHLSITASTDFDMSNGAITATNDISSSLPDQRAAILPHSFVSDSDEMTSSNHLAASAPYMIPQHYNHHHHHQNNHQQKQQRPTSSGGTGTNTPTINTAAVTAATSTTSNPPSNAASTPSSIQSAFSFPPVETGAQFYIDDLDFNQPFMPIYEGSGPESSVSPGHGDAEIDDDDGGLESLLMNDNRGPGAGGPGTITVTNTIENPATTKGINNSVLIDNELGMTNGANFDIWLLQQMQQQQKPQEQQELQLQQQQLLQQEQQQQEDLSSSDPEVNGNGNGFGGYPNGNGSNTTVTQPQVTEPFVTFDDYTFGRLDDKYS